MSKLLPKMLPVNCKMDKNCSLPLQSSKFIKSSQIENECYKYAVNRNVSTVESPVYFLPSDLYIVRNHGNGDKGP